MKMKMKGGTSALKCNAAIINQVRAIQDTGERGRGGRL